MKSKMLGVTTDALLAEQIRYYRARADEYDEAYTLTGQHDGGPVANAAWRDELSRLVSRFEEADLGDEVLEVAAGTGFWTAMLAERATRVTAIDAAPEVLALNRDRLGPHVASVDFLVADLFRWTPTRTWDSCVGCFWLCKVPDDRFSAFLSSVAAAVRPGGTVFFGDKTPSSPSSTETETRTLRDGRTFTVVDRPRSPSELTEAFNAAGIEIDVVTLGPRFCAVTGKLHS